MEQQAGSGVVRREMSGIERLVLRVSNMVNHPIAQSQRWVKIHRLDTDADREWFEVMTMLSQTDGLEMSYCAEVGEVTLRWEPSLDDEQPQSIESEDEEEPPF